MRFNDKYFSFPPFISTSWNHVSALRLEGGSLIFHLTDGKMVSVPGLRAEIVELIFKAHAAYLEKEAATQEGTNSLNLTNSLQNPEKIAELPLRFGITPFDGLSSTMQHNQALANSPDLPKELIQKIISITKIVARDEIPNFPKAEPHCNCFYCQIARSLHQIGEQETHNTASEPEEEIVTEADLQFQQWDIQQCGNQMFSVTNRLDNHETYNVYLGQPVGCTCGKSGCEHILAVLKT